MRSAAYGHDTASWHENDGSESFKKRAVTTSSTYANSATAADVDGDNSLDLLSAESFVPSGLAGAHDTDIPPSLAATLSCVCPLTFPMRY